MTPIRRTVAAAALALALGATSSARAGTTTADFQSDANTTRRKLGSYTGTATYDDVAGLLTIQINNTSTASSGGFLTGVAFNIDGAATAAYMDGDDAATPRDDEDAFDDARPRRGKRLIKAGPLGKFEAGSALNGKWGRASRRVAASGISAGSSRAFVFDIDGAAAGMTAADFLSGNVGIAAAFRGRKADKVGGVIVPGSGVTVPVIPGPGDGDGNGGSGTNPPVIIDPGGVIVPPVDGNGNGNGTGNGGDTGGPAAVPLPPAVWTGLLGIGALAAPRLKRKLRELL